MLPFVSAGSVGAVFLRLSFSAIMVAGVYAASGRRWLLWVALALALPTLVVEWANHFFDTRGSTIARLALNSVFLAFTGGIQVRALIRQERVSADTVLGGINVYLILALAFMMLHAMLEVASPGSYAMGGVSLTEQLAGAESGEIFATLLYFSFTTLTTLGYGDITPVSPVARLVCSLEAVIGLLYVAILIGRLVALQITHSTRAEN
jgi:hypothetical protein